MSLLQKLPRKPSNALSTLAISTRFFTTQNPNPNAKPNSFPNVPTSAYYDELIHAAGRSRDFETLRQLLNKRLWDGCFNTSKTFNFITNNETGLAILDELPQTLARLDKGLPRKNAYDSLIARLCKLRRIDEALRMIDTMAREGSGPNAYTFLPILDVFTRKKDMEGAWRVMDLMRKYQIPPDKTAYNYILMAYCVAGDLTAAAEVLTKMVGQRLNADSRTYDALVLCACKAGKVEGALVVLRRMIDDGVLVQLSTHMYVIKSLLGLGYYAQAVAYVRCFTGRDTWLDTNLLGCLASKLIESKRFDEAKIVLEEMKEKGLELGDTLSEFYTINVEDEKD